MSRRYESGFWYRQVIADHAAGIVGDLYADKCAKWRIDHENCQVPTLIIKKWGDDMPWEEIGSVSTGEMPYDGDWIAWGLRFAKAYILLVCGEPPLGSELDVMPNDHELGSYPSLGVWSDHAPPRDYVRRCERALEVFDGAVAWHELVEHFQAESAPEVDDEGE